jgi:hypothetical protein
MSIRGASVPYQRDDEPLLRRQAVRAQALQISGVAVGGAGDVGRVGDKADPLVTKRTEMLGCATIVYQQIKLE